MDRNDALATRCFKSFTTLPNLVDDGIIRPTTVTNPVVNFELPTFMGTGAGRFATPNEFALVQKFFDSSTSLILGHQYTLTELKSTLGLPSNVSIEQLHHAGGADYLERTFIFANTDFNIVDSAALRFIVDPDGTRHIANLQIAPTIDDNFNFQGANASAGLNPVIQPYIDPWNIGRTVTLHFTGVAPTISDYSNPQYKSDVQATNLTFFSTTEAKAALGLSFALEAKDLWDSHITQLIDTNDSGSRAIIYGTNAGDIISPDNITAEYKGTGGLLNTIGSAFIPTLADHLSDGVTEIGGLGADALTGGNYNDRLYGGADNDHLYGGDGNDTLYGGTSGDAMDGGAGIDTVSYQTSTVGVNVNFVTGVNSGGDSAGDTLTNIENFIGSAYNDTVTGDTGNNTIEGAGGADVINGGAGIDVASYLHSASGVNVDLSVGTAQSGGEAAGDTLTNIENIFGSAGGDTLKGNGSDNILYGNAGNDTLSGGSAGTDILYGGSGSDTFMVQGTTAHSVTIDDPDSQLSLSTIFNLDTYGPTSLDGIHQTNTWLKTGLGVTDPNAGISMYYDSGTHSIKIFNVVENNHVISLGAQIGIIEHANGLTALSNPNMPGSDYVSNAASVVINYTHSNEYTADQESTLVGGTGNDTLYGSDSGSNLNGGAGNDTLNGGAGGDQLDGGTGADSMAGGAGNDTYFVDNAGDTVTESSSAGYDTVNSTISYTLGTNVENLTLAGIVAVSGTGNSANNIILGNAADNVLIGGAGADTINGGGGNDIVSYATASAAVGIHLDTNVNTGSDAAGDVLININEIIGTAYNDTLVGSDANETFIGGVGSDYIDGGNGIDTVSYETSSVYISGNLGTNNFFSGDAAFDNVLHVENLTGSAYNDYLGGDAGANILSGLAGNDSIEGFDGNDTLIGGSGNDLLYGGNGDDLIYGGAGSDYIDGGAGIDTVSYADSSAWVSGNLSTNSYFNGDAGFDNVLSNVENLTGSAFGDYLGGNSVANVLNGGDGNDSLEGFDGNDTLIGGNGNDQLYGGNGDDLIYGGPGSDYIDGGAGNDTLSFADATAAISADLGANNFYNGDAAFDNVTNVENLVGSAYNDYLAGNAGANILDGGAGNDSIVGGDGNDTIKGGDGNDNLSGGNGNDSIIGGAGSDYVDGGAGTDTLSFETSTTWVSADLNANSYFNGDAAFDNVVNVENLTGSAYNDYLYGNASANVLTGGAGDDHIEGRGGNDTLVGGTGNDTFIFAATSGLDTVTGFEGAGVTGGDVIQISPSIYSTATIALSHVTYVGGEAVLDLGSGNSVHLVGVTGLTAGDFVIA